MSATDNLDAVTLMFWFRLPASWTPPVIWYNEIMTKEDHGNLAGDFELYLWSDGKMIVESEDGNGHDALVHSDAAPSAAIWHHVAVILDSTGVTLWIDNRLQAERSPAASPEGETGSIRGWTHHPSTRSDALSDRAGS